MLKGAKAKFLIALAPSSSASSAQTTANLILAFQNIAAQPSVPSYAEAAADSTDNPRVSKRNVAQNRISMGIDTPLDIPHKNAGTLPATVV